MFCLIRTSVTQANQSQVPESFIRPLPPQSGWVVLTQCNTCSCCYCRRVCDSSRNCHFFIVSTATRLHFYTFRGETRYFLHDKFTSQSENRNTITNTDVFTYTHLTAKLMLICYCFLCCSLCGQFLSQDCMCARV